MYRYNIKPNWLQSLISTHRSQVFPQVVRLFNEQTYSKRNANAISNLHELVVVAKKEI